MSRKNAKTGLPASKHPDAKLIQACVDFAIAMRGASGAYEIDPTGNNDFAQAIDSKLLAQADDAQAVITRRAPSTIDGLRAKAMILKMAIDLDCDETGALSGSLAEDVKRFHKAISEHKLIAPDLDIAS